MGAHDNRASKCEEEFKEAKDLKVCEVQQEDDTRSQTSTRIGTPPSVNIVEHPPPSAVRDSVTPHSWNSQIVSQAQCLLVNKMLEREFSLSDKDLDLLEQDFRHKMHAGLASNDEQLRMLITHVSLLPTGTESGAFLALDLGGSNFRVLKAQFPLHQDGSSVEIHSFAVAQEIMRGTSKQLFDFVASCVVQVCPEAVGAPQPISMGFTFSFPCDQTAVDKGTLLRWTKGFDVAGVVNEDVVSLLQKSLDAKNTRICVSALVNDTVGTLIAGAMNEPECMVGVICGTGSNLCYLEKAANISKLGKAPRSGDMIINTEWGAFSTDNLRRTKYDRLVDVGSLNPGAQLFEKQIGGMYLGEVVRQVLMDLAGSDTILLGVGLQRLATPYAFLTKMMSDIEADESPQLQHTREILDVELGIDSNIFDRTVVKMACAAVSTRAARLTAAGIGATCRSIALARPDRFLRPDRFSSISVAMDGSVYKLHPYFHQRICEALESMSLPCEVKLVGSEDGSGVGAAAIAAMLESAGGIGWQHHDMPIALNSSMCFAKSFGPDFSVLGMRPAWAECCEQG